VGWKSLKGSAQPETSRAYGRRMTSRSQTIARYDAVDLPVLYFGTPVALLSTVNPDGTSNLAPMSSYWALGDRVMLGLGRNGRTAANLLVTGEVVINLPEPAMVDAVEALGRVTGMDPVPESKKPIFTYAADKWALTGLRPVPSELVQPPRVDGCAFQIEARVQDAHGLGPGAYAFDVAAVRVHARTDLMRPDARHVAVERWRPLLYVFRHYMSAGETVGKSFRATD
jgi:flavin reductase (DIM6/NTAB) family NADH-FMN oxidoreductase RutF